MTDQAYTDALAFIAERYPAAMPLLANGWTIDAALNHIQGICDIAICTGEHQ